MATGTVTEAVQSGANIRVTVSVDEGAAGIVAYTAQVAIADLKLLDTPLKRKNALVAAVKVARDLILEEDAIDGQLGQLIGAVVTL